MLAEYERVVPLGLRKGDSGRYAAAGDLALADGRLREALADYQRWHDESGCDECGLIEQARVYERLGLPDSAIVYYERLVTVHAPFRLSNTDAFFLAGTYKRLGELYEARHDRAKALGYYTRFVDLWKAADAELQPALRDVRARIARLSSEQS